MASKRDLPMMPYEYGRYRSGIGGGVGGYLLQRATPYLPPWLLCVGTGVVSLPANQLWADSAAASAGLTLASAALTATTWWAGKATTAQRRLHSTVTVGLATSWLTAAALAGPATGPLQGLYLIGGPALAASWNIRHLLRTNQDGAQGEGQGSGGLLEKVGLAKTMVTGSTVSPNKATFQLQLPPGELTADDVAKAAPRLASALDVSPTAVRVHPDPDSHARAQVTIVPRDMLKNTTPWPGPSAPGGSIAEPVVVGVYEDGTEAVLYFPGDPKQARNAMHLLIMGMTGSGKSEGGLTALAEIASRRDVVVWASDPAKADQTLGPLLPALDWAALDMPSTVAMIEAITAAIPARTKWLAKYGYKQWEPACAETQADGSPGMPYLVCWFEEAAKTIREIDDDVFTGIGQEARSAGISLVVSLQRASGTQISTDTRASLGSSWCFGVRSETDAGFALPDEALDAGAAPHAWRDKKPGYNYLAANGVPEGLWATPARSHLTNRDQLTQVTTVFADVRAEVDAVTEQAARQAAGSLFTDRARHLTDSPAASPADAGRLGRHARNADADADEQDHDDAEEAEEFEHIDPEQPLSPVRTVLQLATPDQNPRRAVGADEARQIMADLLEEFEAAGRVEVGPKDFMDHCDRFGRSRGWVSGQVSAMVLTGRLRETDKPGRYRIIPQDGRVLAGV
ncbi:plasmid transfer protein TraB [Streptosporangium sp. NPDC000563]|uniref:plasmid transfer protein TraB n=1 Tax=Streptosporangium sp. NPDC000563 TaxID=3154366 RepID=UPI00332B2C01